MRTALPVLALALLLLVALAGMRRGWRRRDAASARVVPTLPESPTDLGASRTEPLESTYVSTTRAGDWLDRVVAHDLGVRSAALVQVFDTGVRLIRTGARDVFVPREQLRAVGTAPGQAGKFVGRDGLVVLTWRAGPDDERGLDTGLRVRRRRDRDVLVAAVTTLIADTAPPAGTQAQKEQS
jgi:hypothetical protein